MTIIGGGPGGYEAALVAAQLGARVTVVDSDGIGGSAVITDCVPSKTLIATAELMTEVEGAGELGVDIGQDGVRVDLAKVNERVKALAGTNPFDYDDRAGFERAAALAFVKPPELPGRFVDVLVARNKRDRAFLDKTFDALRQPSQYLSVQRRLDKLTMPVMGLWCSGDKISDISALDSLRNGLANAAAISTTTLNGCNHMPMLEKPEQTVQVLTAFELSH